MLRPFQLHYEITDTNYRLEILDTPGIKDDDDMCDFFDAHMVDTEEMNFLETEYGVHDVSYDDTLILGFTSYEWKENRLDDLKAYWSEWLTRLGFKVGKWYI